VAESTDCVANLASDSKGLIVVFASMDGDMVDQHFGSALAFFAHDISADSAHEIGGKKFSVEKKDGNEDKLKPKLSWLQGADIVYCGSIGGSATRQLITLGITPVQVKGGPDVEDLIEELQTQLNGQTEFWLANILKNKNKQLNGNNRFDKMLEESEEESWD